MTESFWFYIILFLGFILLVYLPLAFLRLRKKNRKGQEWAGKHQAAKVYIKTDDIKDWLRIISVNGEEPVAFTEGATKHGFYLNAKQSKVVVLCQWTEISVTSISGYETHSAGDKELHLTAEVGKQYSLCYNHTSKKYEFKEIQ
jgi:hypothetical protein